FLSCSSRFSRTKNVVNAYVLSALTPRNPFQKLRKKIRIGVLHHPAYIQDVRPPFLLPQPLSRSGAKQSRADACGSPVSPLCCLSSIKSFQPPREFGPAPP